MYNIYQYRQGKLHVHVYCFCLRDLLAQQESPACQDSLVLMVPLESLVSLGQKGLRVRMALRDLLETRDQRENKGLLESLDLLGLVVTLEMLDRRYMWLYGFSEQEVLLVFHRHHKVLVFVSQMIYCQCSYVHLGC